MISELVVGGVGLITTIASGWTSWFFARKKYNSEVEHNYIDNLQEALKTYDSIIQHNKAEIENLMKRNDDLQMEVSELRKQMLTLTMNICLDLTCQRRVLENISYGKSKDRSSKAEDNSSRRSKPITGE